MSTWGWGVTTFFTFRSQEGQDEFFVQARSQAGEFALLYELDNFDANMYGLLWKAGLGLNLKPFTAGLTVTTPNVRMAGSGILTVNDTWPGSTLTVTGPDDGFVTDIQTDVNANHKSPLSVGLGAAWHFKKSKFHFSAEWFDATAGLRCTRTPTLSSRRKRARPLSRSLQDQSDSVLNFGLGFEHTFTRPIPDSSASTPTIPPTTPSRTWPRPRTTSSTWPAGQN